MCGSCVYILLALVATLAHSQPAAAAGLVVSVDPILGNDIACLSAQELLLNQTSLPPSQTPCQTVNKALGNVRCDVGCRPSGGETIENVTIRLEDGIHTLTECVGVLGSSNVTFEATNPGMATIECTNFQNSSDFDNLFVCNTIGVMFRGIQFEHCGPISANVFLNDTSDIVFEDCTFRQVYCGLHLNLLFQRVQVMVCQCMFSTYVGVHARLVHGVCMCVHARLVHGVSMCVHARLVHGVCMCVHARLVHGVSMCVHARLVHGVCMCVHYNSISMVTSSPILQRQLGIGHTAPVLHRSQAY